MLTQLLSPLSAQQDSHAATAATGAVATTPATAIVRGALDAATRAELAQPGRRSLVWVCERMDATTMLPLERLHLRSLRRGRETVAIGGREIRLDEGTYLIADATLAARGRPDAHEPPALGLFAFGSDLLRDVCDAVDMQGPSATASAAWPAFLPTLRPHGDAVTRRLLRIERLVTEAKANTDPAAPRASVAEGIDAIDEQLRLLLGAMLDAERRLRQRADAVPGVKPATRRELLRRVLVASDFIRSRFEQPLQLADIAAAACLSSFHLLRLFEQVHGMTPHAFLVRERRAAALRLLARTRLDLGEIALRTGFGTRSSLFRHLRSKHGSGGRAIRCGSATATTPVTAPAQELLACSTRV